MTTDIFDEQNEVKPQSINWGKVGDNVAGTKVGQRKGVKTKFGLNTCYEIKVSGGFFHDANGEKVELQAGDIWSLWGRNDIFNAQMDRMQIGQIFGLKFTESKPSTMGNDAKIIKVFTKGEIDTAWLESNPETEDGYQVQ
jgi:hypothetical protein